MTEHYLQEATLFTVDRLGRQVPGVVWWDICPTCRISTPEPHDHRSADLDMILAELKRHQHGSADVAAIVKEIRAEKPQPQGEHMSLKALSAYAGLSVRKLRSLISATVSPIPHHRIGGRVLVKRSDFDLWAAQHRKVGVTVDEKIARLKKRGRGADTLAPRPRRAKS